MINKQMNRLLGSGDFFSSLLMESESEVVVEEKKRVIEGGAVVKWDLGLSNLNSVETPAAFLRLRAIEEVIIDEQESGCSICAFLNQSRF